ETSSPAAQPEAAPPMDSAAMMKAWQEYATPGEMHAMLAKSDGVWNADVTMWMNPDAPPAKSTATVTNRMILGGRYQEAKHSGSFEGMPFEGISILGYDNAKKKFVNTWIDNMGSGIMMMEGTWDETSKTIHFTGNQIDPMTGSDMEVRQTLKIADDNHHIMEMYMKYPGSEEYKSLEIHYTRAM
ncbi:MAG TPA: DUF1579 domain-containing protein, partial [Chitinophagales bacterium]|nr:DUF1579 domain-containing protein [Chitinophagales bacterium]